MKIRRVVTGQNEKGQSVVEWDSELESVTKRAGYSGFVIWATKELPVKFTDDHAVGASAHSATRRALVDNMMTMMIRD